MWLSSEGLFYFWGRMETIQNQTIESESFAIDDICFINCTIINCILEYSGGPVMFNRTRLQRCRYVFSAAPDAPSNSFRKQTSCPTIQQSGAPFRTTCNRKPLGEPTRWSL